MSQENVELARRAAEAWNEEGPESVRRLWAEDGEWHDPPNLPDSRVVRGRDAVAAYLTDVEDLSTLGRRWSSRFGSVGAARRAVRP